MDWAQGCMGMTEMCNNTTKITNQTKPPLKQKRHKNNFPPRQWVLLSLLQHDFTHFTQGVKLWVLFNSNMAGDITLTAICASNG